MRRLLAFAALLASCAALVPAQSRPLAKASSAHAKVAVISFDLAVFSTNEFRRDYADLQKKYEPTRAQIQSLTQQIKDLQTQLEDQRDKLSEIEIANRTLAIQRKQIQLRRLSQNGQNDFEQDVQSNYSDVAAKLNTVLAAYAKAHGYTLVVGVLQQHPQNQPVLWANPSADITRAVVNAYNAKSGIPAPPPSASKSVVPAPAPHVHH